MTPSSLYPRQRPSRGTLATIFVGFTGWGSYLPIAKDGACSSARVIYRGSQLCPNSHGTILSRMLDESSVIATNSDNRGRETRRSLPNARHPPLRELFVRWRALTGSPAVTGR